MRRAVFLDRDGVLIADRGYVHQVADVELLPGVRQALQALRRRGWLLVVVTNQSGIGRGLFTLDQYQAVTTHLRGLLPEIDEVYCCPHAPAAGCACRKPQPGMLLQAASDLGIDLRSSVMLGDRESDLAAGIAAGCRLSLRGGHEALSAIALHQHALDLPAQHVQQEAVRLLDPGGGVAGHDQRHVAQRCAGPAIASKQADG